MKDEDKTKDQLINELMELRQRVADLEKAETEHKRVVEALQQLEEFHESIVQSMGEGIVVEDAQGYITFVNPAASAILGYDPEELVGQHWAVIIPPEQQPIVKAADERRARGESDRYEVELVRKDGMRVPVLVTGSPRFEKERFVGTIAVFTDMTEIKWAQEEAVRRLERLKALREIDRAISSSLELEDRLNVLLDKLTELPHIDGVSVMVLKPGTKELETVAVRDLSEEFAAMARVRLRDGLPHLVAEQEKPLVITDLMTNERVVYRDLLKREELASYIGLPLLAKGELIGVLEVYSRERHRWSQEQTDFFHTLTGQAAIALHNAELYDQVLQRAQTIEAMREIDRTVLSGLTLKEVTEAIAATIGRLIPYDRASIAILEDDTFNIVASIANGQVAIPKEVKISAAETFLSEVVAGQQPVYRPDISTRERLYRYDKQLLEEGITSDLIIPLVARGKVLGTLNLGRYQRSGFDEKAIALAEELARQLAIAIDNALAYQRLKELNLQTITALSTAMGAKDPYTEDHSAQVTRLAVAIAERMGLPEEEIENLRVAGLLHDIGKIGIPGSVLNKPARLTRAEFTMIEEHPVMAAGMVEKIGPLSGSVPAIRHHHERYNGQGYPDGLQGEEIPLLARIMAVADGYDAMSSERPYRRAKTPEEALAELKAGAGAQWDPEVVKVFLGLRKPATKRRRRKKG